MKAAVIATVSALSLMVAAGAAADFESYAKLGGGAGYESNIFLSSDDERASASVTSTLDSGAAWKGETSALELSLSGRYQPYEDSSLTAATSVNAATSLTREHEYGQTSLRVGYSNASSSIDAFDSDGKFVGDERQEIISSGLARRFDLSERSSLQTRVDGYHVTYSNTPNGVFRENYDFANGNAMWRREMSERLTLGIGAVGSWYGADSERFRNRITTAGPAVSASFEFNERLAASAEFSYRVSQTQTRVGTFDADSTGNNYLGHLDLTRQFDRGFAALTLRRSVEPSSNGQQDIRDEAGFSFTRELSGLTNLRAGAVYIENRSEQTSAGERTACAADLAFDWTLTSRTQASFGYRFQWQDQADGQASAHTVMLTVTRTMAGGDL